MFRFFRRKVFLFLVIFAAAVYIKHNAGEFSQTVAQWISGAGANRVAIAVSDMIDSLAQGNGVRDSVEVFGEALQD